MKVQLYNKIAKVGLDVLPAGCEIGEFVTNPDAILVRSAVMHGVNFNKELLCIGRAGAGVNNIPVDRCADEGIVVFNTPGANANAVKELALCALFLASRDIVGGIAFANGLTEDVAKAVEKGKGAFAGNEIAGKTLGIIGLGAIGGLIANSAIALGMKVVGCDPFLSVEGALRLNPAVEKVNTFEDVYKKCDYVTLHVPATEQTKGMINKDSLAVMKDGVKILNLARAELVNATDLKDAIANGKVSTYVTDFPTEEVINVPHIIAIPHLGASSEEAEDNCAVMAAHEIVDYVENGNITNSVNFPNATLPREGSDARICVMHKNVPGALNAITAIVADAGLNIDHLVNKSKGERAYTMLDVTPKADDKLVEKLTAVEGVIRVRII